MTAKHPRIQVIVPVYEQTHLLAQCLKALGRQTLPRTQFDVTVVDNGSTTPPTALCRRHGTQLFHQPVPGSYAARNLGARQGRAGLLAFTDADCLPRPDWLAQALAAAKAQPGVSAWGGRIDMPLGLNPTAVERLDALWGRPQQHFVEQGGWADTANFFIRRGAFDQAQGFPEVFSGGDHLLGPRLSRLGLVLAYAGDSVVTHPPLKDWSRFARRQRRLAGGMAGMPSGRDQLRREVLFLASGPLHPAWEYFRSRHRTRHGHPLEFIALRMGARAVLLGEWLRLKLGGRAVRA